MEWPSPLIRISQGTALDITLQNRQRYRMAAVNWLVKVDGALAVPALEKVSRDDVDLQVRGAAIQQLNDLRKK